MYFPDRSGLHSSSHLNILCTAYLVKGKLAHNFMVFYLVMIPCLLNMARTYITEENIKFNIFCICMEKKIKFRNSYSLDFESVCYVIGGGIL